MLGSALFNLSFSPRKPTPRTAIAKLIAVKNYENENDKPFQATGGLRFVMFTSESRRSSINYLLVSLCEN